MSKKYLLPNTGNFYKANLHCHSTFSDGKYTVEHLKDIYKSHGYSIVAFSDHNKLVPHTELEDSEFLPITSIEIDISDPTTVPEVITYHINFFSKDKNRSEFVPFTRTYDIELVNKLIKDAADNGFLAQYNHPRWSFQTPADFLPLENLWGFEVFNTGCELEMIDGWGDYEYEVTCRNFYNNNKAFPAPAANDDNHNQLDGENQSNPKCDSYGGWTMVKAEKLDYQSVMKALEEKNVYASTGPEIFELYSEDGKVKIKTSPCCGVALLTNNRPSSVVWSHNDDITETELAIPQGATWFRLEVIDSHRHKAMTMAYINE